ncbi:N-acetyltransferase family protein [Paracoccaceae bacterium GXU_MW_L88]
MIREARAGDLPAITGIYAHHVRHGLATYEEVPPDLAEMTRRFEAFLAEGYPYIVWEEDGTLLGYAYGGPFRTRSAYRYLVEDSVYLSPDAQGRGIGSALLAELLIRCEAAGFRQMVAVIGDGNNRPSIALHAKHGFAPIGTLPGTGFKLGQWVDTVIMQRPLGEGKETLPE